MDPSGLFQVCLYLALGNWYEENQSNQKSDLFLSLPLFQQQK